MFEQNEPIKLFVKTTKQVIEELENINSIAVVDFNEAVINAFDNYNVEGEEEIIGFEDCPNLLNDSNYILNIKIDHENAYEFSIHIAVKNSKVTVTNVL